MKKHYLLLFALLVCRLSFAQLTMVANIYPGSSGSSPKSMVELNGNLFFIAYTDTAGYCMFKFDGVNPPVGVISGNQLDISGTDQNEITVFNSKMYFAADDGVSGSELWEFDGINAPLLAADIHSGASGSFPRYFTAYNNKLYFQAYNTTNGTELFAYDGNTSYLVADFLPGPMGSAPIKLTVYNNALYFAADTSGIGSRSIIWSYNGFGTNPVIDPNPSGFSWISDIQVFGNKLCFFADIGGASASELWAYDGTSFAAVSSGLTAPNYNYVATMGEYNNKMYFAANDAANGTELWTYDGTNMSSLFADIKTGTGNGSPIYFTAFDNKLFFTASDDIYGTELRYTDGNTVKLVGDIRVGTTSASPQSLIVFNGKLYFNANDGTNGFELWSFTPCVNTMSTMAPTACESFTSPSGKIWTTSNTYKDTIPNAGGCDSIITVALTIKNNTSSSITTTSCSKYTSPSGQTFNTTGLYTDTIANALGCDSIITINLTISTIDTSVTQNGLTLSSNETQASYKWVDCNNNYAIIPAETNKIYTPTSNGFYAVIVTNLDNCIDTSACYNVVTTGVSTATQGETKIFPNPSSGKVAIAFENKQLSSTIEVTNVTGQIVKTISAKNVFVVDLTIDTPGIYFVKITNDTQQIFKLIIE